MIVALFLAALLAILTALVPESQREAPAFTSSPRRPPLATAGFATDLAADEDPSGD
jgi:hypothetical protein